MTCSSPSSSYTRNRLADPIIPDDTRKILAGDAVLWALARTDQALLFRERGSENATQYFKAVYQSLVPRIKSMDGAI